MKNNCHFITSKFCQYDIFSDQNNRCYRIITNKEVYYFYEHQFSDVTILDELKNGDRIQVGSHQLDDGTYWLHWLVSFKGDLSIRNKLNYCIPHHYTFIFPLVALACFLLNLEFMAAMFTVFSFCIISWCFFATLFRLVNLFLPKQIFLRNQFFKLKKGDMSLMKSSVFEVRKALLCLPTDLPVYEGIANNVSSSYYDERQTVRFNFNRTGLFFTEYCYSLANFFIPVIYYSTHPTFIATGDKLSLVFARNKIQGMINHSDGASYLFCHCLWMSKKKAKVVLRYLYALTIPTGFFSILFFTFDALPIALGLQFFPLLLLLCYTLFSLLNDRSYTRAVLNWLQQTTGKWPKEI
ncbi:hypothetical protein [Orbus mooreae]|uniref:hypothetical protein n=1 Tax=Orbus mooreae TaxID=3074107 RepID=UPI00370D8858